MNAKPTDNKSRYNRTMTTRKRKDEQTPKITLTKEKTQTQHRWYPDHQVVASYPDNKGRESKGTEVKGRSELQHTQQQTKVLAKRWSTAGRLQLKEANDETYPPTTVRKPPHHHPQTLERARG